MNVESGGPYSQTRMSATSHLTAPGPAGWSFWTALQCRTAGFPSELVLKLADPECTQAADSLALARSELTRLCHAARSRLKGAIRQELHARGGPCAQAAKPARLELIRSLDAAVKALDRRRWENSSLEMALPDLVPGIRSAARLVVELEAGYAEAYRAASARVSAHLKTMARDEGLLEAVTWQSKQVVTGPLAVLAAAASGAENTRHELLLASYVQRYCVKNDTIGFFGPVGWAAWSDEVAGVQVAHGLCRLSARNVYFEDWAIQRIANRLSADRRLRRWMVPTPAPYLRQERGRIVLPGGIAMPITSRQASLLTASRTGWTAGRIAAALLQDPFCAFDDEAEIIDGFGELAKARWLHLGFGARLGDRRPELSLSNELEVIEDEALREEVLGPLRQLCAARDDAAAAAGRQSALLVALQRLDQCFEAQTGEAASRNAGQTYGARTIVYEDCLRGAQVRLGPEVKQALLAPLELVLTSARWYCHRAADLFRESLEDVFQRLAPAASAGMPARIDMPTFWLHAQELFYGDGPPGLALLRNQLNVKWSELLLTTHSSCDVQWASSELRPQVTAAFESHGTSWPAAVHHSPDVMIAAPNTAAIERGDMLFVLGELHVGINTLINHAAIGQHPEPARLLDALHADLLRPRLIPRISREGTGQPIRVQTVLDPRHDVELRFSLDALPLQPQSSLALSDLCVSWGPMGLQAGNEKHSFDVMEVFSELVSGCIADKFSLLPVERRSARVTIDRLVVQRRTWRIPCAELAFLAESDPVAAFAALRAWALAESLPRWCFVKVSWERKPFYLDFSSPLYVRALAKHVRRALKLPNSESIVLVFSEMLPAHGQIWMPLEPGVSCTSEFRMVAVHRDDRLQSGDDRG